MKSLRFSRLSSPPRQRHLASMMLTAAIVTGFSSVAFYGLAAQTLEGPRAPSVTLKLENTGPLSGSLAEAKTVQVAGQTLDAARLKRVYEGRNYTPIWTRMFGAGDARRALEALASADKEGLAPENYRVQALTALWKSNQKNDFELLMTDTVLNYAQDVKLGRVRPEQVDDDIQLPRAEFDAAAAFSEAVDGVGIGRFLSELAPRHPQYNRLKAALVRYRALAEAGGWETLPAGTTSDGEGADLLRARLIVEDHSLSATADAKDASDLIEAVKRFQARNGLKPDGKLGKKTIAALNMSADERVTQIAANMERWRWMPANFEQRYIAVNTADATLDVIDHGRVSFSSNVVVGLPSKRTPILRAEVIAVTVNPIWHVPYSIASKELLPKLRRNPNYLRDEGMYLADGPDGDPHGVNVDWNGMSKFRYSVRQESGPKNALGVLKLELPNKFNVYLHDTPSKRGFAADARQLSHGCVRVEQINALASLAWKGDAESGLGELSDMIAAGETKRLPIAEPLPVYLSYWTALVDENGDIEFRADVYGRDRQLTSVLKGQRVATRSGGELGI